MNLNMYLKIDLVTKKSLVQKCRDMNIKGYTKLSKEELVEMFQIIKELEEMSFRKNYEKRYDKRYTSLYDNLYKDVYNEV